MGRWSLLIGLVLLAGCASTPPPELTKEQYVSFAQEWVDLERCKEQGNVSPEIGALGTRYMSGMISRYQRDTEYLKTLINQGYFFTREVPASKCNIIAANIAGRKQEIDIHNAWVDQNRQSRQEAINRINNNRPVICNTVGTYTMCQ